MIIINTPVSTIHLAIDFPTTLCSNKLLILDLSLMQLNKLHYSFRMGLLSCILSGITPLWRTTIVLEFLHNSVGLHGIREGSSWIIKTELTCTSLSVGSWCTFTGGGVSAKIAQILVEVVMNQMVTVSHVSLVIKSTL